MKFLNLMNYINIWYRIKWKSILPLLVGVSYSLLLEGFNLIQTLSITLLGFIHSSWETLHCEGSCLSVVYTSNKHPPLISWNKKLTLPTYCITRTIMCTCLSENVYCLNVLWMIFCMELIWSYLGLPIYVYFRFLFSDVT